MPRGARKVYKYSLDGALIKEFPSVKSAHLSLGLRSNANSIEAIKNRSVFYGFIWKREDYEHSRRTVAYDPFTNVYFFFKGVYKCAREMFKDCDDITEWRVSYSIRSKKLINGFMFFHYDENSNYKNVYCKGQSFYYGQVKRPILKLQKGTGEVIKRYECVRDAALEISGLNGARIKTVQSSILDCCKRTQLSAYGSQWRFA